MDRQTKESHVQFIIQLTMRAVAECLCIETFNKCSFLFKLKEMGNFYHMHTLIILRNNPAESGRAWPRYDLANPQDRRRAWEKRGFFQRAPVPSVYFPIHINQQR